MSIRMNEFLKRLFSLKNAVPLLIIVFAFASTFLQNPFGLQRDQIIIALLAFLAIDSLIERLEMLHSMEQDINRVKDLAETQLLRGSVIKSRTECPPFEHVIEEAKKEILIGGINLAISATKTGLLRKKAEEGVRIRFLAINPKDDSRGEIANYFGYHEQEMVARIRANLYTLHTHLVQSFPKTVELRTISHRLANGYFIVDPHTDKGQMTITAYLYKSPDSHFSPVLFLTKSAIPYWFEKYLDDFSKLWNDASEWVPDQ